MTAIAVIVDGELQPLVASARATPGRQGFIAAQVCGKPCRREPWRHRRRRKRQSGSGPVRKGARTAGGSGSL